MPTLSALNKSYLLKVGQEAISNTLGDAEILMLVGAYGYTSETLQEGQQLYDAAIRAVSAQTAARGAQRRATGQLLDARRQAHASFQALAQLVRVIYGSRSSQCSALGLIGPMPQTTAKFKVCAIKLFDNARTNPEISRKIASHGYDSGKLEREHAVIAAFIEANSAQVAAMGAARQATRDQTTALTAFNKWLSQYLGIARIALRDKPQLLKKIGGNVRAGRTAAQRGAARKAAATRAANQAGVAQLS